MKNKKQLKEEISANLKEFYSTPTSEFFTSPYPIRIVFGDNQSVYVLFQVLEFYEDKEILIFENRETLKTLHRTDTFKSDFLRKVENSNALDCLRIKIEHEESSSSVDYSIERCTPYKYPPVKTDQQEDLNMANYVLKTMNLLNNDPGIAEDEFQRAFFNLMFEIPSFTVAYLEGSSITYDHETYMPVPPRNDPIPFNNELIASKLKQKRHKGIWAMDLVFSPFYVPDPSEKSDFSIFYNIVLLLNEHNDLTALLINHNFFSEPAAFIDSLAAYFEKLTSLPQKVVVGDTRTYKAVKNFLVNAGVEVVQVDKGSEFQDLEDMFLYLTLKEREPESTWELSDIEDIVLYLGLKDVKAESISKLSDLEKFLESLNKSLSDDKSNEIRRELRKIRNKILKRARNSPQIKDLNEGNQIYLVYYYYKDSNRNERLIKAENIIPLENVIHTVLSKLYGKKYFFPEVIRELLEKEYILDDKYEIGDYINLKLKKLEISLNVVKIEDDRSPGIEIF